MTRRHARAAEVSAHLDRCPDCRAAFESAPGALEDLLAAAVELPAPSAFRAATLGMLGRASTGWTLEHRGPPARAPGFTLIRPLRLTHRSEVYLARQHSPRREVVLKFVRSAEPSSERERLRREGSALAALRHPHILTLHQTGTWASGAWMALEFCPRGSLQEELAARGRFACRRAAELVAKVAWAAAAAHRSGVTHNDIKPANVLLSEAGEPRLADFGMARSFSPGPAKPAGRIAGTPAYMAPEQTRGGVCDARTDVHGLGALLYELLAGRPPFEGEGHFETMLQAAHREPDPPATVAPGVPADLSAICMRCLEKQPIRRYQSATAVARDLRRFLAGRPVRARRWTRPEAVARWIGANRLTFAALCGAFSLLLASVALLAWMLSSTRVAWRDAESSAIAAAGHLRAADDLAYANAIQAALFEVEAGNCGTAWEMLDQQPFGKRGWEHRFLTGRLLENQVVRAEHGDRVAGLALSPDGSRFATVSMDRSARLWDGPGARPLRTLLGGEQPLVRAAWSADGRRLALADASGRVTVLGTGAWESVREFRCGFNLASRDDQSLMPLALSADGTRVWAAAEGGGVGEWLVDTGEARRFPRQHAGRVTALATGPPGGGALVSVCTEGDVVVWDVVGGGPPRKLGNIGRGGRCVAVSPDGAVVAASGARRAVFLWSLGTGTPLEPLRGHWDYVNSLDFSPDGSRLASSSDDQTVRLWDVIGRGTPAILRGHRAQVSDARFSPDGRRLLTASADRTVRVWDHGAPAGPAWLLHQDRIRTLAFSPDGGRVAMGSEDSKVRFWSVPGGRTLRSVQTGLRRIDRIRFSPAGATVGVSGPGPDILLLDAADGSVAGRLEGHGEGVTDFQFGPGGAAVYSASADGAVRRWSAGGRAMATARLSEGEARVLAVSPDGRRVAVAGSGGLVRLLDPEDLSVDRELPAAERKILSVAFSPDGGLLAAGTEQGRIRLWDAATGEPAGALEGHIMGVMALAFSPDGARLASAGLDRTVRLWDPAGRVQVAALRHHGDNLRALAFSPDGNWLASGGDGRRVLLLEGSERMEEQRVLALSGRSDLESLAHAISRADPGRPVTADRLLSPGADGRYSISRAGPGFRVIDREAAGARRERERALLESWR